MERYSNQSQHEIQAQMIYEDAIETHKALWSEIHDKFPDYNSGQACEATKWIMDKLQPAYGFDHEVGKLVWNKVFDGMT